MQEYYGQHDDDNNLHQIEEEESNEFADNSDGSKPQLEAHQSSIEPERLLFEGMLK